jgi:hypothetical protein
MKTVDHCSVLKAVAGIYKSNKSLEEKIRLTTVFIKDFDSEIVKKTIELASFNIQRRLSFSEVDRQTIYSQLVNSWITETKPKCLEYLAKLKEKNKKKEDLKKFFSLSSLSLS